MTDPKPRRRLKWLLWILGILLGPAVVIVVVLKIIFVANAIPKDRQLPPAELLVIKPLLGPKPVFSISHPVMTYEDFIKVKDIKSQVIEIYSNRKRAILLSM